MSHEVMDGDVEQNQDVALPDPPQPIPGDDGDVDLDAEEPPAAQGQDGPGWVSGPSTRVGGVWPRRATLAAAGALLIAVLAAAAGSSLGASRARDTLASGAAASEHVAVYLGWGGGQAENGLTPVVLRFALLGNAPVVVTHLRLGLGVVTMPADVTLPAGKVVWGGVAGFAPDCALTSYVDANASTASVTVHPVGGGAARTLPADLVVEQGSPGDLLMSGCSAAGAGPEVRATAMTAHPDGTLTVHLDNPGPLPASIDVPAPAEGVHAVRLNGPPLPFVLPPGSSDVVLRLRYVVTDCTQAAGLVGLVPDTGRLYPTGNADVGGWDYATASAAVAAAITRACP